MKRNKLEIVYICGRGHSGTTALDLLIGTNTGFTSLGELSSGLSNIDKAICSCGKKLNSCGQWSKVINKSSKKKYVAKLADLSKKYDNFEQIFISKNTKENKIYNKHLSDFYNQISTSRNVNGVIDSSKELSKGLRVVKSFDKSKLIYVRRSLPSILLSYQKRFKESSTFNFRRKKRKFRSFTPIALTTIISQIIADFFYIYLSLRFSKKIMKIRYESMETRGEVQKLMSFISPNNIDINFKIDMDKVHIVGGNRMARAKSIIEFKTSKVIEKDFTTLNPFIVFIAKIADKLFY